MVQAYSDAKQSQEQTKTNTIGKNQGLWGDSEGTRLKSLFDRQEEVEPWGTGTRYARPFFDEVEAQSKLGGTVDGATC